ncbi:MAG: SAM-dependent methyltransferase [Planctomycetaceae bacterium]|nr:SAM-dependent methyltransferase [Planctomycetaceae bacterium]
MNLTKQIRGVQRGAPDIASSTIEYRRRFSGSVGRYFLERQTLHLLDYMSQCEPNTVLDVGGGHGQAAIPLVRQGYEVTVVGSDASCELLLQQSLRASEYAFVQSDLLNLPFPDETFDVVVALRLMAHLKQWPLLIKELCRVSRYGVIIDYPENNSFNRCHRQLFGVKQAIEKDARPFQTLSCEELVQSFGANGFDISSRTKQFFLPMAIHRALKTRLFSSLSEWTFRKLGLTSRWGSPGFLLARRYATSHRNRGDDS